MTEESIMTSAFERFRIDGKAALVTGGGSGVGFNIARALARAGAEVVIAARRESLLQSACERLNADPLIDGRVGYRVVDLADRIGTNVLASYLGATRGGIDIFVGNAAIPGNGMLNEMADELVDSVQRVNVTANIDLVRALLPHMRARKWGRIIFISSAASVRAPAQEGLSIYSAAKAALEAFGRAVAAEAGRDGITANSLILGTYRTEMYQESCAHLEKTNGPGSAKTFENFVASISALGRIGECEDIEGVIQLLASDAGRNITGSSIPVDGGMTIMLRPNPIAD
jgi:NAD(P)-dependent dehydrogenase (short-subunit alcohol dehydrogenase family)